MLVRRLVFLLVYFFSRGGGYGSLARCLFIRSYMYVASRRFIIYLRFLHFIYDSVLCLAHIRPLAGSAGDNVSDWENWVYKFDGTV